jgi:hypothetical protein
MVEKFEEDPKCSGNICREVVTVNNAWPSGLPILDYQIFLFFLFLSIHLHAVVMNIFLKCLTRASTDCKLSLVIKCD